MNCRSKIGPCLQPCYKYKETSSKGFCPMADTSVTTPPPSPGLPPVAPPTARMFLRLFLVPALIVGGLVAVLVLFSWAGKYLAGGGRSPQKFLQALDDANPDVRWQAASDLAQVLLRDDQLASDPDFALELTARLDQVRLRSIAAEENFAVWLPKLTPEEAVRDRKPLEADRNYIVYLGSCLGNFMLPVGAPELVQLASQDKGLEPRALAQRRLQAVWALANLGDNLSRFDKLSAEQQASILDRLAVAEEGPHADWARKTAEYLKRRREGHADAMGVDKALIKCADAESPAVREMAAFAMNFWHGNASEDARLEEALVRLSSDDGRGEEELERQLEEVPSETRALCKRPGFRAQANATVALARRGSPRVRLGLLEEMLDPEVLGKRFVLKDKRTGKEEPQEELVAATLVNALKAVAELHKKRPEMELTRLVPRVDKLAGDANRAVATEAAKAKLALEKSF